MNDWNKNFTEPTADEFLAEIRKRPDLIERLAIDRLKSVFETPEEYIDYLIYDGDIESDGIIEFDAPNVIVKGNVKAKVLSLSNEKSGADEGGSFFVYGDVECDYFENHFGKMTVIAGSLKVNKILNAEFDDSCLRVLKDVTAEYFHCPSTWINVKGKAKFNYGDGYSLPLTGALYEDTKKSVEPEHSTKESHKFLGIGENLKKGEDIDDAVNDFMYYKFEALKNNA